MYEIVGDVADAMLANADGWVEALDETTAKAHERAAAALDEFEQALNEISVSMGVASWLKSAREHGRFDQRLRRAYIGTVALSSKRRTANGQPVETAEAIGWLREAIEPPTSAPTPAQA